MGQTTINITREDVKTSFKTTYMATWRTNNDTLTHKLLSTYNELTRSIRPHLGSMVKALVFGSATHVYKYD